MEKPKCKICGERHWGACQYTVRVKAAAQNAGPVTVGGIPITRAGTPIMTGDLVPGEAAVTAGLPGQSPNLAPEGFSARAVTGGGRLSEAQ